MTVLTLFEVTGNWLSVSAPAIAGNNSDPQIEQVSGLVTFTPRLARGTTFQVDNYLVTEAYNTIQQVWLISNPIAGTFRLMLDGFKTNQIAYNASASAIEAELATLPPINGLANVAVTDGTGDSFNVEFTGALVHKNVPQMGAISNLTNANGQNCPISVTVSTQGTAQITADTAISLPPITARIWNGRLCAIDSVDSPGLKLTANSTALGNPNPLIYDVTFNNVRFNGEDQVIAPFAFVAPTTATSICLTDPTLQRLPYDVPIPALWTPAGATNWRLRAV